MRVPRSLWEATKLIRWTRTLQGLSSVSNSGSSKLLAGVCHFANTVPGGSRNSSLKSEDPIGDIFVSRHETDGTGSRLRATHMGMGMGMGILGRGAWLRGLRLTFRGLCDPLLNVSLHHKLFPRHCQAGFVAVHCLVRQGVDDTYLVYRSTYWAALISLAASNVLNRGKLSQSSLDVVLHLVRRTSLRLEHKALNAECSGDSLHSIPSPQSFPHPKPRRAAPAFDIC